MDCETCKEKRKVIAQTPKDVPYNDYEVALARLDRIIKRLCKLIVLLIILLVASLSALIWLESQVETVETTIEAKQETTDGNNYASHKSTAICWRYQKAKGITKNRAAPVKRCCPFYCIFSNTFSISKTFPYSPYFLLQNFFIGLSILLCRSFSRSQYCGRYR